MMTDRPYRRAATFRLTLLAAALAAFASSSRAAALRAGDAVILALETPTPAVLRHVEAASGAVGTIVPTPALAQPLDVVVRRDGTILVADVTLGIVAVDPTSGAATAVATAGELGGGPTTLAFDPKGDLLVAGSYGVSRLAQGAGTPVSISGSGLLVRPRGIASDGGSNVWITDDLPGISWLGRIVHLDPATGAQALLPTTCVTNTFPVLPLQVRYGRDGFLYVLGGPYGGPSNYNNSGIFRVDPNTGVATRWNPKWYLRGFDFDANGVLYLMFRDIIHHDPASGLLTYGNRQVSIGEYGPVAIVSNAATPVRSSSWGAVKALYR